MTGLTALYRCPSIFWINQILRNKPEGYDPCSGGLMESFAQDDRVRHEMCRNLMQLKSGGPVMWVEDVQKHETLCHWFENDKLRTAVYPSSSLVRATIDRNSSDLPQMFVIQRSQTKEL